MFNETYSIPKAIKRNIPEYFYGGLLGELIGVNGVKVLSLVANENGKMVFDLGDGNDKWVYAFKMACKKCYLMWLYTYYISLLGDHEEFAKEIDNHIINNYLKQSNNDMSDSYYCFVKRVG